MKKAISKIMTLAIASVMIASIVGCTTKAPTPSATTAPSAAPAKTITMGTNAEFPPFEFVNDSGAVDGFDVAMVKAIAQEIGAEIKIENMEFKSLIASMETGRLDIIAAAMTVTDDRKKSVNFTDSYYTAKQKVIVKADNNSFKVIKDLTGKKIGVQEGTTGDFLVSPDEEDRIVNDAKVSRYKKAIDAVMDLKAGRIDAVVIDSNPAQEFVSKNPDIKIIEIDIPEEYYAIAINKNNPDLLISFNAALKKLKENGTYDRLIKEYINK